MEQLKSNSLKIFISAIYSLVFLSFSMGRLNAQTMISPNNPQEMEEIKRAVRLKDYIKAAELCNALARKGDTDAQYQLGVFYQSGKGVVRNYIKALSLFQHAAEGGHPKAQYSLAQMYENGWGTKPDYPQALIWYKRSAEQGYVQALAMVKGLIPKD